MHTQPQEETHKPTHSFGLKTMLAIVIGISILIVAVGYGVYLNDEKYKYDIARPGDEKPKELTTESSEINDTTSLVDEAAVDEKIKLLEEEIKVIDGLGDYESSPVSDSALQLDSTATPTR